MIKAETVRRRIVDYTKQEMVRQGIVRLTMDAIAQGMGMSKRTLYELFPGKACLVKICLATISDERRRLLLHHENVGYSYIDVLFDAVNEYILLIHYLGKVLLVDLTEEADYQSFVKREEAFWLQRFIDALTCCKACDYLLPDIDPERFADELLLLIYENCLRGVSCVTQRLFCQALLRGVFQLEIIPMVDKYIKIKVQPEKRYCYTYDNKDEGECVKSPSLKNLPPHNYL